MPSQKQGIRGPGGGYSTGSTQERRRRSTCHALAHKSPTSTIFLSRTTDIEPSDLACTGPSAEGSAGSAREGRLEAAVNAALKEEALECFGLFDRDGDGLVKVTEVVTMLRSLGFVVLPQQVRAFESEMKRQKVTTVDFQTFCIMVEKGLPRRVDPVEILNAFHLLDRQKKGSVNIEELHQLLTTVGEPLTEDDWRTLLSRTLTVRECATPVSMKSGTFFKLICSPVEGESEWWISPAFTQPSGGHGEPLL